MRSGSSVPSQNDPWRGPHMAWTSHGGTSVPQTPHNPFAPQKTFSSYPFLKGTAGVSVNSAHLADSRTIVTPDSFDSFGIENRFRLIS